MVKSGMCIQNITYHSTVFNIFSAKIEPLQNVFIGTKT